LLGQTAFLELHEHASTCTLVMYESINSEFPPYHPFTFWTDAYGGGGWTPLDLTHTLQWQPSGKDWLILSECFHILTIDAEKSHDSEVQPAQMKPDIQPHLFVFAWQYYII